MKEIILPKRDGVDDNGKEFGLPEFVTDILFTRPDLLRGEDFCEMVVALMPVLRKLHGSEHAGKAWRLSDAHHRLLLGVDWSNPRIAQHSPESALVIAKFRLAVKRAKDVAEKVADEAPANGKSASA